MRLKALKIALLTGAALLITVAAGTVWNSQPVEAELPEYVGSDACLGCHTGTYEKWSTSGHSQMLVQVMKPSDLPAPLESAAPDLAEEIKKADWIVAGTRFLARDPMTGEMKYLNAQYDVNKKQYVAYKGGSSWTQQCAGCHSTGWNVSTKLFADPGIGCEMCHGPGRDHIKAKGDPSKIHVSGNAQVCGQCHNGTSGMPDGTRWPVGYKPGQNTMEETGFTWQKVDPAKPVPEYNNPKLRQFAMWEASGHANATNLLIARGPTYLARTECIKCHSTSAGMDIKAGKTWDATTMLINDGVSCQACHDSHGGTVTGQLKKEPQELCMSCHSVGRGNPAPVKIGTTRAPHSPQGDMLAGTGALGGVPDTVGAHTELKCIDCHMTEGNHLFKVVKPADVMDTKRKDSCSACHTNSGPESRGTYLEFWQETVSTRLDAISVKVTAIEEALKANPEALTAEDKTAFEQWRANFWYVRKDNSKGAHNFEYSVKILTQTQKEIDKLWGALK